MGSDDRRVWVPFVRLGMVLLGWAWFGVKSDCVLRTCFVVRFGAWFRLDVGESGTLVSTSWDKPMRRAC